MKSFEGKVSDGLKAALAFSCLDFADLKALGVAVSGGADSVSLLCSLKNILPEKIALKAVTVNHNIRPESETSGDADYVESLCKTLGVPCVRYEIPRGLVEQNSLQENKGIEDSARKLRYEKFSDFMKAENIDFLCLAHNKNDQEETVLMRILSGSTDLSGIPLARGRFLRPLLNISRSEIEDYLKERNISFRTDSTNLENEMTRNRIRNILVPVLDKNFAGWKTALENLSDKSFYDSQMLENLAADAAKKINFVYSVQSVTFDAEGFFSLHRAIKTRILMMSVKKAGAAQRIPQAFLWRWTDLEYAESKKTECCAGLSFSLRNGKFNIEKKCRVATEEGFSAIIEESGTFYASGLSFSAAEENGYMVISCGCKKISIPGLRFPFVFRSRQSGDEIKTAGGTFRSVSKILDGWKVLHMKDKVPVIQQMTECSQNIKCIWGSLYGFSDWIVAG